MKVNNILYIRHGRTERWCFYAYHWCSLPVFITQDDRESRSALYSDGTSMIILGAELLRSDNRKFLYNRLWHEVAHLYFRDVWKPWELGFEYRADLVSAAATGRDVTLCRLHEAKASARTTKGVLLLEMRIEHLRRADLTYSKADALHMLQSLRPVTVAKCVRGNQYI